MTEHPRGGACLDENDAVALVHDPRAAQVHAWRAHIDECDLCRELVAAVARYVVSSDGTDTPRWIAPHLAAGAEVGRYRVVEHLGRGAMGSVYLATDSRLRRRIALKLLDAGVRDDIALRRLRLEARSMAQLHHPNVVEVLEVGVGVHGPYMAMAYVDGWDLRTWTAARPRSRKAIVDCLLQAGRGLLAAHEAGLVHRDFKPANILVGRNGVVQVADFGLATAQEDPQSGMVAGTPAYMAPEQLVGGSSGPAADQFAFCVTAFEALAGHRPFAQTSAAALVQAIESGRLVRATRRIPSALLRVIRRGLHADPKRRFADMGALLRRLESPRSARFALAVGASVVALAATQLAGDATTGAGPCSDPPLTPQAGDIPARVQDAWGRIGASPHATDRVVHKLDEEVRKWGQLWQRSCVAARSSAGSRDAATLACLGAHGRELAAFAAAAKSASAAQAGGFAEAAAELRPASECMHAERWKRAPGLAQQVAELQGRYLRSMARGGAGELSRLRADIETAAQGAHEVGADIEEAMLWRTLGVLDNARGDHANASRFFERAYFLAITVPDAELAFEAALAAAIVAGGHRHAIHHAERWLRHARSQLHGVGSEEKASLLVAEGNLALLVSEPSAAREAFGQAASLLGDRASAALRSDVYGSLGRALAEQGDGPGCREAYAEAIRIIEQTQGPTHVDLPRALVGIASCEVEPGLYDRARAHLRRAAELSQQHGRTTAEATALYNLGLVYREEGRPGKALLALQRSAVAVARAFPADHQLVALSDLSLATAYLEVGQWERAAAAAQRARALFESQPIDAGLYVLRSELAAARADLMVGAPRMRARLSDLRARASDNDTRNRATLALAEALVADGRDDRAVEILGPLYADGTPDADLSVLRLAQGRLVYARALRAVGNSAEAQRQLQRALADAAPFADYDPQGVVAGIRSAL